LLPENGVSARLTVTPIPWAGSGQALAFPIEREGLMGCLAADLDAPESFGVGHVRHLALALGVFFHEVVDVSA
jgi:hypothetical protein